MSRKPRKEQASVEILASHTHTIYNTPTWKTRIKVGASCFFLGLQHPIDSLLALFFYFFANSGASSLIWMLRPNWTSLVSVLSFCCTTTSTWRAKPGPATTMVMVVSTMAEPKLEYYNDGEEKRREPEDKARKMNIMDGLHCPSALWGFLLFMDIEAQLNTYYIETKQSFHGTHSTPFELRLYIHNGN